MTILLDLYGFRREFQVEQEIWQSGYFRMWCTPGLRDLLKLPPEQNMLLFRRYDGSNIFYYGYNGT